MSCLDLRTCLSNEIQDEDGWRYSIDLVKDEYIELFCARRKRYRERLSELGTEGDVVQDVIAEPDDSGPSQRRCRMNINLGVSTEARYALARQNNTNNTMTEEDYQ